MLDILNKKIYISKRLKELDDYGKPKFAKPKMYMMNVQPVSSKSDMEYFGDKATEVQKAIIEKDKYLGKFSEFDRAYLDGATPFKEDEDSYGSTANYELYPPRNQNLCICLYFRKIVEE